MRGDNHMIDITVIIASALSLIGTLIGTLGGILVSNKLTTYRIEQLETKVTKHNNLIERTYVLEGRMKEVEDNIETLKSITLKEV